MSTSKKINKLIWSGACLALCFLLPFLTGQIPSVGNAISPMHIPVLLCGFICGWPYGLVVGFIAPLLRSVTLGMPPLFPIATAMAFELAAYGAFSGLLYQLLPKKTTHIYISLIGAMLLGRVVWGLAAAVFYNLAGNNFTFAAFLAGAFIDAVPALIIHIALIPVIFIGLKRSHVLDHVQ